MTKSIKKYPIARVIVPAAPVRKRPSHKQEMCNQLLFGDELRVLEKRPSGWIKIQSVFDNYIGWVTSSMLDLSQTKKQQSVLLKNQQSLLVNKQPSLVVKNLTQLISIDGKAMLLPMGASVPVGKLSKASAKKLIAPNRKMIGIAQLISLTKPWLNVPYLWGGKTPMGVDCSGFVQVIYKMMGITLLRDAEEQATQGKPVKSLELSAPGDLLFFNRGKKIIHVGIYLGNGKLIHSSGSVRIDIIDKKGIVQMDSGKRTHKLCAIKRVATFK